MDRFLQEGTVSYRTDLTLAQDFTHIRPGKLGKSAPVKVRLNRVELTVFASVPSHHPHLGPGVSKLKGNLPSDSARSPDYERFSSIKKLFFHTGIVAENGKKLYSFPMNLENIVIVLCRPEESRNVGAVCRAMANCSLSTLRIVGKKEDFDDTRVRILAIHSAPIWEKAVFFDSIKDAVADCTVAAGTTRRRGKKRGKLLFPEEFTEETSRITESGGKAAIVFGNERTGLTDEELDQCNLGVTIPTSESFASMNLSHAVQVMGYHIFRSTQGERTGYTPITLSRLDKTVTSLADSLQKIGFFSVTGRDDMEKFWTDLLSRASLSESEAQYIEKIFDKAAGLACSKRHGHENPPNQDPGTRDIRNA